LVGTGFAPILHFGMGNQGLHMVFGALPLVLQLEFFSNLNPKFRFEKHKK
jgi:hypothetical protein